MNGEEGEPYMVETGKQLQNHKLVLDGRKNMQLTGVTKALSIEPELILLVTSQGKMKITGKDMHVTTLDMDRGVVDVTGLISCLCYTGDGENFGLKRLFK
jgi:sporulation protein YabP